MKDLKQFNIPFVGLSEGNHDFTFKIENEFFEFFNSKQNNIVFLPGAQNKQSF